MEKESSLSKMIFIENLYTEEVIRVRDVKEKIQNARKKINKIEIKGLDKTCKRLMLEEIMLEEIDKIFLEEFGDDLI